MGHRKVVSVAATMTMATAAGAVGAIASPPPPVAAGPDSVYTYHANICERSLHGRGSVAGPLQNW